MAAEPRSLAVRRTRVTTLTPQKNRHEELEAGALEHDLHELELLRLEQLVRSVPLLLILFAI